jgi:hypothetical protein
MSEKLLAKAVASVLHKEARKGQTTRNTATILTMKRIEDAGGPTKFGIGAAAMRMAFKNIVGIEVMRQMKLPVSGHDAEFILPQNLPEEVKVMLFKMPHWIALEEGVDAIWKNWRKATSLDWLANAVMKQKKAHQTLARMRYSEDIALYLEAHNLNTLGDLFGEE